MDSITTYRDLTLVAAQRFEALLAVSEEKLGVKAAYVIQNRVIRLVSAADGEKIGAVTSESVGREIIHRDLAHYARQISVFAFSGAIQVGTSVVQKLWENVLEKPDPAAIFVAPLISQGIFAAAVTTSLFDSFTCFRGEDIGAALSDMNANGLKAEVFGSNRVLPPAFGPAAVRTIDAIIQHSRSNLHFAAQAA